MGRLPTNQEVLLRINIFPVLVVGGIVFFRYFLYDDHLEEEPGIKEKPIV